MKWIISNKKSILFGIGFLFFGAVLHGQDMARIQRLLAGKELARAREAVDSAALQFPTAEVWLNRAAVYNAIAGSPETGNLVADAKWESFQSLQKALQADTNFVNSQSAINAAHLAAELYNGFTGDGLKQYNAGAEREDISSFATALASFKKAAAVGQLLYNNKWGKPEVDTLNLFYLAKSAINADKETDAIFYSKKIVDENLLLATYKQGYELIYQWLVYLFKSKKEDAAFYKYLELGRKEFPSSSYFVLAELDWLREQQQYTGLFKRYEQLLKEAPANENYRLAFYRDQFDYLWSAGETGGKLVNTQKLTAGLQKLTGSRQQLVAVNARLLLAKQYINQSKQLANESLMRSTTDKKILDGYKTRRRGLLLLANKYLKQISSDKTLQQPAIKGETEQLLTMNAVMLKGL